MSGRSRQIEALQLLRMGEDDLKSAAWLYRFGHRTAARLKLRTALVFIEASVREGLT